MRLPVSVGACGDPTCYTNTLNRRQIFTCCSAMRWWWLVREMYVMRRITSRFKTPGMSEYNLSPYHKLSVVVEMLISELAQQRFLRMQIRITKPFTKYGVLARHCPAPQSVADVFKSGIRDYQISPIIFAIPITLQFFSFKCIFYLVSDTQFWKILDGSCWILQM